MGDLRVRLDEATAAGRDTRTGRDLTRGHNEAVGERKVEGAGGVSCLRWRGPRRSPEEGGEGRTVPQEGQVFCSKWCPYGSDVPRRSSDYIPSKNAR